VAKGEQYQGKSWYSHQMASLLSRIRKLMSLLQGQMNKYSAFMVNGKPNWDIWLTNHLNILWSLIRDINLFREAQ
jgi:hypothetical protein